MHVKFTMAIILYVCRFTLSLKSNPGGKNRCRKYPSEYKIVVYGMMSVFRVFSVLQPERVGLF